MTAPAVTVVPADTPERLAEAQRFRYAVLVDDLGQTPRDADHGRRRIADGLDATGANMLAYADGALVGAVRINVVADGGAEAYAAAYGLDALGPGHAPRTAIVTRLVSRAVVGDAPKPAPAGSRGGGAVLGKLVEAVLGVVAARDLRWIAIGADPSLVGFYRSMGFAPHLEQVDSPSGARRDVLLFDREDPRHAARKTLAGWLYPALFAKGSAP